MSEYDMNAELSANHPAVKAAFSAVSSEGKLAEWMRQAVEAQEWDVIAATARYIHLDKGKLDSFPTGKEGQQTRAYKAFNVFRMTFRNCLEGYTLKVNKQEGTIEIKESNGGGKKKQDDSQAKADKALSEASETAASLLETRDKVESVDYIAKQCVRLGIEAEELAEAIDRVKNEALQESEAA